MFIVTQRRPILILWFIVFVLDIVATECVAVNIQRIEVPPLVEVGTEAVILDCQYKTNNSLPPGLVMKWFFNGSSGLVYQWIPPLRPQVIGLLKGKVDLDFRISEEPLQAYRAIKILKPTTDLSGNYTCVVSSFIEEDRQTRPMLVYSPGKNFHFVQEKKYVFLVTLICGAEDLYPRPEISILSQGKPLKQAVSEMKMNSWGLYAVSVKAVVHDDDVTTPYEEFTCTLSVLPANYTTNRTTIYYPGKHELDTFKYRTPSSTNCPAHTLCSSRNGLMPTAYIAAYEVENPQERHANGNPSLSRSLIVQLFSAVISTRFVT